MVRTILGQAVTSIQELKQTGRFFTEAQLLFLFGGGGIILEYTE